MHDDDLTNINAGDTVWCRTAGNEWWETTAAGPLGRSIGRHPWPAVPVLGWDLDNPDHPVNWPAEDVRTTPPDQGAVVTRPLPEGPC